MINPGQSEKLIMFWAFRTKLTTSRLLKLSIPTVVSQKPGLDISKTDLAHASSTSLSPCESRELPGSGDFFCSAVTFGPHGVSPLCEHADDFVISYSKLQHISVLPSECHGL